MEAVAGDFPTRPFAEGPGELRDFGLCIEFKAQKDLRLEILLSECSHRWTPAMLGLFAPPRTRKLPLTLAVTAGAINTVSVLGRSAALLVAMA